MIKYCVWDVGETIYNFSLNPLEQWIAVQSREPDKFWSEGGLRAYSFNPYMLGKLNFEELCGQLCRKFEVADNLKTRISINRELHRGVGRYFAKTREMMVYVKEQGMTNAVFSNAMPILADTLNFPDVLESENIFTSYQAKVLKPDAAAYEYVRKSLNCRFDEMIFVDNKPANVATACRLGMKGIVFDEKTIQNKLPTLVRQNMENRTKMSIGKDGRD